MIDGTSGARKVWARAVAVAALGLVLPASVAASESEGGLVLVPDGTMLVGLIVLFLVLIYPVNELLFKPIFRVLDEREQRIAGTRAKADQLERDAEAAFERYEQSVRTVREEAEQARRSALEGARSEALAANAAARGDVERELEGARGEIAQALESARGTLRGQSQELAREAASRVLGRAL
jgi:F-type H+-transporting ATPase subunit b